MKKQYLLIGLLLPLFIISCNDDNNKSKDNIINTISDSVESIKSSSSKLINSINDGVIIADSLLIKSPIKYFKNRIKTSDSLNLLKISNHINLLESKYHEYHVISKWFESSPPELMNEKGNFYKIIRGVIKNGKSVERIDMVDKNEFGTYRYFYETEDNFYLLELSVFDNKVSVINIRRIHRGIGDEPMHDLLFDGGVLNKEVYQCDVNPEFYEKDNLIYFEQSLKQNNKEIINTVELNKTVNL